MTKFDFYHLQTQRLEEVLPVLLEKAYQTKQNIRLLVSNEEREKYIDSLLWTYKTLSFLPHGTKKDSFAEMQPIYISSNSEENPNKAEILFLIDNAKLELSSLNDYKRVINIFNGNLQEDLTIAREFWKELRDNNYNLQYWQQDANGRWAQKG